MIITRYTKDDFASFIRCVKSAWDERDVYDAVDYQLIDPYWYEDNVLHNVDYVTLIAKRNDEVIGFMVGRVGIDTMKVIMLFVSKDFRKLGYGRMLKEMLTKEALHIGMDKIQTFNRYDNIPSIKLNNELGWTITHLNEDYYKAELNFNHKTIREWGSLSGIWILNSGGFDNNDPYLFKRRFSKVEYVKRVILCVRQIVDIDLNKKFFNLIGDLDNE